MTYKELMRKAQLHFDPENKGIIYGYPVRVMLNISLVADDKGWDNPVDVELIRDRLLGNRHLDKDCVAAVLSLLGDKP